MEFSPEGPKAIPLWVNGRAFLTVTESFFDVVNPHSGEAVHRVPLCGAAEAAEAAGAARAAQPAWAALAPEARQACLDALADGLDRYTGHFVKLLRGDTGFPEAQAQDEVAAALAALRGTAVGEAGVVALVVDATRPLASFAEAAAPILRAGGAVIVKPSPKAPAAAFALCELSGRAAWPPGVLNLMQGDTEAIDGLCCRGIDRLVYAGNAALGVQVGAIADAAGKPYVMLAS
jgi:succinate-semialdehyde dehydrogenase / glutarate-semialdehyde dehydrogenase